MPASFQPRRLQQARYLSRMSLAELGAKAGVTRQSLSQFERGDRTPAPATAQAMASKLDVPVEFFLRPFGRLESSPRSLIHYRSLRRTRDVMRERQRAGAILDLCAAVTDSLEAHIEYQPAKIPAVDSGTDVLKLADEDIEQIAQDARRKLGLGDGPISDVALLVENQSIIIVHEPLSLGMDGLSAFYGDRPFIVVTSECSYARDRLNVAHEFGHLVLHQEVGDGEELDTDTFKRVEDQAWRFAGAFMLPAKSFLSEVYSVSLDALALLKQKWGVSIAAMIRRLRVLGVIDVDQTRYLNIQLRQRGWSKVEPGDDRPRETARLMSRAVEFLAKNGQIPLHEFCAETKLPLNFLASALELDPAALKAPIPKNVVQFKLRAEG